MNGYTVVVDESCVKQNVYLAQRYLTRVVVYCRTCLHGNHENAVPLTCEY